MKYERCIHFNDGGCYNAGKRNGLNTLDCIGYDRCDAYETEQTLNRSDKTQPESEDKGQSRVDIIGQNGGEGTHYLVVKIARAICGEAYADQALGERKRWETHVAQAMRVMEVIEDE